MLYHYRYNGFRSARGDGNCYYRACAFSFYEYLIDTPEMREPFMQKLDSWVLPTEYQMKQKEKAKQLVVDMSQISSEQGQMVAKKVLAKRWLEDDESDKAVIETFRFIASQCVIPRPGHRRAFHLPWNCEWSRGERRGAEGSRGERRGAPRRAAICEGPPSAHLTCQ